MVIADLTPAAPLAIAVAGLTGMLLQLAGERQTGAVVAKRGEEAAVVYLRDGKIVGASAPWAPVGDRAILPEAVARTIQQVVGWEDCELRFHARVQPRRPQLTYGVEVRQALHWLPGGTARVTPSPTDPLVDPIVETQLAELFGQLSSLVLWATVKQPNRPHLALIEALHVALHRLLAQHRKFHAAVEQPRPLAASPAEGSGAMAVGTSGRHRQLGLAEAHRTLQRRFPALEAVQIVDGQLDLADLLPTYDLLAGPARAAFYGEVVQGLLALAGQVVDNLVKCELRGRAPAAPTLAGWRAFVHEIERRLEAVAA